MPRRPLLKDALRQICKAFMLNQVKGFEQTCSPTNCKDRQRLLVENYNSELEPNLLDFRIAIAESRA